VDTNGTNAQNLIASALHY